MYKRLLTFLMAFVLFSATVVAESVGYTIDAEDQSANCNSPTIGNANPGDTVTYKAQWEANQYSVTYNCGDSRFKENVNPTDTVIFDRQYLYRTSSDVCEDLSQRSFSFWLCAEGNYNANNEFVPISNNELDWHQISDGEDGNEWNYVNDLVCVAMWSDCPRGYHKKDGDRGDCELTTYYIGYHNVNNEDWENNANHPTDYTIETPMPMSISNPKDRETQEFTGWCVGDNTCSVPVADFSVTVDTNGYAIDCLVDGNMSNTCINLYAQWACKEGYELDSETGKCEKKKYDISYGSGLHGSVPNQGADPVVYTDGLTYNQTWTTKSFAETGIVADEGYTFSGWNTNADGTGTPYVAGVTQPAWTTDDAGLTLYAIYTPKHYTVTYDKGDTNAVATGVNNYVDSYNAQTGTGGATYDQNYVALTGGAADSGTGIVAAEGYTFCGWSEDADATCTNGVNFVGWTGESPWQEDSDKTVYAIYKPNPYLITYNCGRQDAGEVESDSVVMDGTYTLANNGCELTGYTFAGWYCPNLPGTKTLPEDADAEHKLYFEAGATGTYSYAGNTECTAQWTANNFEIVLNKNEANGGDTDSTPNKLYTTYGGDVFLRETRDSADVMYTSSNPLTERPGGKIVTLTFAANLPREYTVDDLTAGKTSVGTRSGEMVFNGFYDTAETTENETQYIDEDGYITQDGIDDGITAEDNQTWYAHYDCVEFVLPTDMALTGYEFKGWYDAQTGGNKQEGENDKVCLKEGATYYAHWEANKFTITYNKGNVESAINIPAGEQPVEYDGVYVLAGDVPTATGHTFAGWYCPNLPGTKTLPEDADAEHKLYFEAGARGRYTLLGNVVCTAQWAAESYTVTYDPGLHARAGVGVYTDSVSYGANYRAKDVNDTGIYAADGYVFCGWSETNDTAEISQCDDNFVSWTENSTWPVDGNKTVYAIYKPASYQITFDCGEAPVGASTELVSGIARNSRGIDPIKVKFKGEYRPYHKAPTSQACSLPGYEFDRWECDKDEVEITSIVSDEESAPVSAVYNIAGDTACHATWKPLKYNISYNCGQGTGNAPETQEVTFDAEYNLAPVGDCSLEGYTLIEDIPWNCTPAAASGTPYTYVGNTNCEARYDINTNDVEYKPGAHATSASQKYVVRDIAFGAAYALLGNTSVGITPDTGYIFKEWNCNNNIGKKTAGQTFSMPDADVTCEAQWDCATNYDWNSDEQECVPDTYTITYVYIDTSLVAPNKQKVYHLSQEYINNHKINNIDSQYTSYSFGTPKSYPTSVNITGYENVEAIWYEGDGNVDVRVQRTMPHKKSSTAKADVGDRTVYVFVDPFVCPDGYQRDPDAADNEHLCWKECPQKIGKTLQGGRVYYEDNDESCEYLVDTYTITYDNQGHGELLVDNLETYNYDNRDDIVPLNPLVPRDGVSEDAGYRFEGWYDNQGFTGNPVTVVPGGRTGDFTLYAKWNPCSEEGTEWDETAQECVEKVYHIEYVMNGGQLPDGENNRESFTWSERNLREELHNPVKTDSVFGGWYDNPEFNGDTPVTVVPNGHTEDFTLYAKWIDGVMALFDCNNPDPDDNNRTTQFPIYDLAVGDSVVSPDSEECGILVGELVAWDCTDNSKYSLNGSDTITVTVPRDGIICTADIDLSEVDFNINYRACDSNGNEVEIPEEMSNDWPKIFKPAHPIAFPTNPSFEEYKFNGWYTACSGGYRVSGTTQDDTRDVTVYAHLQRKPACSEGQYLNASLRCINCPDEYPYADAGIESRNDCYRLCDTSEGYTANRERIYYSERNNRNIRCELVPNDYSITYMDGDEIKATDNYTYGTEVTLRNYSKTGYVFNGWCDGAETCDTILGANSKQTGWIGDKILYAQLTPKDYPIVYMDGNQAITTFDDVYYSYKITDNVSLKDTYIKAGYVFHGWKDADNNSITGWEAGEAPADANGTVTVHADLEAIDYHVNYYCDENDDNAAISDSVTFGDSYVYRTKVDGKENCDSGFGGGYTFNKWTCEYGDDEFDVNGNRVINWNIASDVNCYAAPEASPYDITYFDGTLEFAGLNPDKYTIIENITLPRLADYPDILVKTGYKFIGWKDAEDTDVTGWNAGTKTGDVAVYAQWDCADNYTWNAAHTLCEPNAWPITYKYKDEPLTGLSPVAYNYGEGATLPLDAGITHDSYEFAGWCTDYNATTNTYSGCGVTSVDANETGAKVFYATWNFVCESGKWWHIGTEKICLYNDKPEGVPAVRINTANGQSYLLLKEGQEYLPIHKGSQKKFHILKGETGYNAYDKSVEDW